MLININLKIKIMNKKLSKKAKKKAVKAIQKSYDAPIDSRKLRRTDSAKIASKTGMSQSHVCNVLSGRRFNATIVKAAKQITKNRKAI